MTSPEMMVYVKEFEEKLESMGGDQLCGQATALMYAFLRSWTIEDDVMMWVNDLAGGLMPISETPGTLIFVNKKVINYFNYTEEEWLNAEYEPTLVHEDDLEITTEHMASKSQLMFAIRMRKKGEGVETDGKLIQQRHLWFEQEGMSIRITLGEKIG